MIDIEEIKIGDTVYCVCDCANANGDLFDCRIEIEKDKIIAVVEFENGFFALASQQNYCPITDCSFCVDDDQYYWFTTKKEAIEKARELAIKNFIIDNTKESEENKNVK